MITQITVEAPTYRAGMLARIEWQQPGEQPRTDPAMAVAWHHWQLLTPICHEPVVRPEWVTAVHPMQLVPAKDMETEMTADPRDTPMGVADPGLNPQLQAAMELAESATVVVEAMTNIRDQFIARGWEPGQAQRATLLMWQSSMADAAGQAGAP